MDFDWMFLPKLFLCIAGIFVGGFAFLAFIHWMIS